MSQTAGDHWYKNMKHKQHQNQRKRSLKYICHIPESGLQCADKRHKRKSISNIRYTMLRNIRKKHARQKTDRRYKSHPFLYKTVKFSKHIPPLICLSFLQFNTKKHLCKKNIICFMANCCQIWYDNTRQKTQNLAECKSPPV